MHRNLQPATSFTSSPTERRAVRTTIGPSQTNPSIFDLKKDRGLTVQWDDGMPIRRFAVTA
jgi:hypothetical protein